MNLAQFWSLRSWCQHLFLCCVIRGGMWAAECGRARKDKSEQTGEGYTHSCETPTPGRMNSLPSTNMNPSMRTGPPRPNCPEVCLIQPHWELCLPPVNSPDHTQATAHTFHMSGPIPTCLTFKAMPHSAPALVTHL